MSPRQALMRTDTSNLADVLERVLDKGIVIAGDITVRLVDIELLTIQIRLVITSVDKARELGMDWMNWWIQNFNRTLDDRKDRSAGFAELEGRVVQPERPEMRGSGAATPVTAVLPEGTAVLPEGTAVLPGGTAVLPGGAAVLPGGTTVLPGGTTVLPGGTTVLPGGTAVLPGGTTVLPRPRKRTR